MKTRPRLPRGIPAASLKRQDALRLFVHGSPSLPRGIPAASLKPEGLGAAITLLGGSSAGNTRGLIEARISRIARRLPVGLPRGIPAASLKPVEFRKVERLSGVFRGEYPRPH